MGHKLKTLGVGVVAVLALSLVASSVAPAAQFTAAKYPTTFEPTGNEGTGKFETEAGTTQCKKITTQATLSSASSTATVNAAFSECTAFGFLATVVQMNGCYYTLHVSEGSLDNYKGSGDLVCPTGKEVVGIGGAETCVIHIPEQVNAVQIEYVNKTAEQRVEGKVTGSNIHYTVVKDGFACPFSGTGTKNGAKAIQSQPALIGGKEKPAVID